MGNKIVITFIVGYLIATIAYLFERDYARALYFFAASLISVAILTMD